MIICSELIIFQILMHSQTSRSFKLLTVLMQTPTLPQQREIRMGRGVAKSKASRGSKQHTTVIANCDATGHAGGDGILVVSFR